MSNLSIMASQWPNFLTAGAIFGASLTMAGIFQPSVVIDQMQFQNFDMMRTFVVASIVSTLILQFLRGEGFLLTPPRPRPSSLSFSYSANIMGGFHIGMGMALCGTCPGSILPQIGLGIVNIYTLCGCIFGAFSIRWFKMYGQALAKELHHHHRICHESGRLPTVEEWKDSLRKIVEEVETKAANRRQVAKQIENGTLSRSEIISRTIKQALHEQKMDKKLRVTIPLYFDIPVVMALDFHLKTCYAMLAYLGLPRVVFRYGGSFRPFAGGLCIGLCQISNVLLTGNPLGISAAWEHFVDLLSYLTALLRHKTSSKDFEMLAEKPEMRKIIMALGAILGPWVLVHCFPGVVDDILQMQQPQLGRMRAFLGGASLIFGSRLAGGCPSGHGISGLALMSTASFMTVGAMFGAAGAVGLFTRFFGEGFGLRTLVDLYVRVFG